MDDIERIKADAASRYVADMESIVGIVGAADDALAEARLEMEPKAIRYKRDKVQHSVETDGMAEAYEAIEEAEAYAATTHAAYDKTLLAYRRAILEVEGAPGAYLRMRYIMRLPQKDVCSLLGAEGTEKALADAAMVALYDYIPHTYRIRHYSAL